MKTYHQMTKTQQKQLNDENNKDYQMDNQVCKESSKCLKKFERIYGKMYNDKHQVTLSHIEMIMGMPETIKISAKNIALEISKNN